MAPVTTSSSSDSRCMCRTLGETGWVISLPSCGPRSMICRPARFILVVVRNPRVPICPTTDNCLPSDEYVGSKCGGACLYEDDLRLLGVRHASLSFARRPRAATVAVARVRPGDRAGIGPDRSDLHAEA